jgi:hypothetical protein
MNVYYKKTDPTKTITIVDEQESFYQLSDGQMIKKEVFSKYYELGENQINESVQTNTTSSDFVDPDSFLNGSKSFLPETDLQKIKEADPSKGAMEGTERTTISSNTTNKTKVSEPTNYNDNSVQNESLIKQVDPASQPIPNNTNTDVSQYKVYDDEDEAYDDFVNKKPQPAPLQKPVVDVDSKIQEIEDFFEDEKMAYGMEEAQKRKSVRLRKINQPVSTDTNQQPTMQPSFDPAEMMFKSFKRNHDITINIKIKDKIGNPDFIKMMIENMDGDVVGFYKNLIMNKIMSDTNIIEDAIENSIKKAIFGDDVDLGDNIIEVVEFNEKDLIKGDKTKSGKQKYKFINSSGKVVDMVLSTAKKKGYKPYKK